MILLTDGEDIGSSADIKKAVEAAQRADIIVYALLVADRRYYTSQGYETYHGDQRMRRLAKETAGGFIDIRSDAKRLDQAFERIELELRKQYSLGYVSSDQRHDGKFRKIKISARHGYQIQARRGYYAPSPRPPQVVTAGKKSEP
jgi:VWFA-related protein